MDCRTRTMETKKGDKVKENRIGAKVETVYEVIDNCVYVIGSQSPYHITKIVKA